MVHCFHSRTSLLFYIRKSFAIASLVAMTLRSVIKFKRWLFITSYGVFVYLIVTIIASSSTYFTIIVRVNSSTI